MLKWKYLKNTKVEYTIYIYIYILKVGPKSYFFKVISFISAMDIWKTFIKFFL